MGRTRARMARTRASAPTRRSTDPSRTRRSPSPAVPISPSSRRSRCRSASRTTWRAPIRRTSCASGGEDPCRAVAYLSDCSVPGGAGKNTTFGCGVDASQLPDGPVTVCAIAADAAVPDNPSSADQTRSPTRRTSRMRSATPSSSTGRGRRWQSTHRRPWFGSASRWPSRRTRAIRARPSTRAPRAGSLATARRPRAGGSVNHSFDQPGTYVVRFRAKDQAGNESSPRSPSRWRPRRLMSPRLWAGAPRHGPRATGGPDAPRGPDRSRPGCRAQERPAR